MIIQREEIIDETSKSKSITRRLFQLAGVALLILVSLGSWAFASPVGSSPDDGFHLTSIWCANGGYTGICEADVSPTSRLVAPALIDSPTCFAYQKHVSAKCQLDSGILTNLGLSSVTHGNYSGGGYPPVYYATMHLFASTDVVTSVLIMRFFNILLFTALAISLWLIAPIQTRFAQKLTWGATLVPLGVFLLGSNNPSSWAIMGIGFSAIALYSLLFYTNSRAKSIALGIYYFLAVVIAAGSRGDSAAFSVVVALIVSIAALPKWKIAPFKLVAPLTGIIVSAAFYLSSGHAGVASNGLAGEEATDSVSGPVLLAKNIVRIPNLLVGTFTGEGWGLGWLDTPMPEIVWVTSFAVCFSVIVISIQKLNRYSSIALFLATGALVGVPLYILQTSGLQVGEFVQPRYIYPLVIFLTALSLLVYEGNSYFGSRAWRIFGFFGITSAYIAALYVNMDRYIHGLGHPVGFNLNANMDWWWIGLPLQPMTILLLGSVSSLILLFIVFEPLKNNSNGIGESTLKQLRGHSTVL